MALKLNNRKLKREGRAVLVAFLGGCVIAVAEYFGYKSGVDDGVSFTARFANRHANDFDADGNPKCGMDAMVETAKEEWKEHNQWFVDE